MMATVNPSPLSSRSRSKDLNCTFLPNVDRNLILLNPLLMKKLQLEKLSPVLITTQNGKLLQICWPDTSCEETNALLPAFYLLKHYTTSPFILSAFGGNVKIAHRIMLHPMKYRTFMNEKSFKLHLAKKLDQLIITDVQILHIKYLGFSCSFTVEIMHTNNCKKSFEDMPETNLLFRCETEKPDLSFGETNNANFFTKTEFQSSTPISSPKLSSVKNYNDMKSLSTHNISKCILNESETFYKISKDTLFVIDNPQSLQKSKTSFQDMYGLCEGTNELKLIISNILNKDSSNISRGILITGPPGTGKSTLLEAIRNEYEKELSVFDCNAITNIRSSVSILKQIFKHSKDECPSVILFDNIDKLCEELNSSGNTTSELTSLMFDLLNSSGILLVATSQSEFSTPSNLQQNGLLEKRINLSVPSADIRKQILRKFLKNYVNSLNDDEVNEISNMAHGFTGGDLQQLCLKAHSFSCVESYYNSASSDVLGMEHFCKSFEFVKPSSVAEFTFTVPNVKWEDIGGMEEVKNVVKEMVDWPLKYPEQCRKLCFTPPRGVLLYGPPGVAKTMIAKALATESKINFINVELSGILSKYVGESEKAVSELFKKARSASPCVLFIDEIDAVAPKRGSSGGCSDAIDRIVSQLLIEIDGIDVLQKGVCIMTATNRPDMIDPSLLRPGRLDCCIYVGLPSIESRKLIFLVSLQKRYTSPDVDIDYLSKSTENYTGAEIVQLCDEASKLAIQESISSGQTIAVDMKHLLNALTKVQPRTSREMLDMFENYNKKFAT